MGRAHHRWGLWRRQQYPNRIQTPAADDGRFDSVLKTSRFDEEISTDG